MNLNFFKFSFLAYDFPACRAFVPAPLASRIDQRSSFTAHCHDGKRRNLA